MPRAAGLADELKRRFGVEAELIKGSGGVFEVILDAQLIFSKKKEGRFPDFGEVEKVVGARLTA